MRVHRAKFSIMKKYEKIFKWKSVKVNHNGQEIKAIKPVIYNTRKIPFNLLNEITDNEKNRRN